MKRRLELEFAYGAKTRQWPVAALFLAVLAVGGCGTARQAGDTAGMLGRASTALDVAKTAETKRYAAAELAIAEEKLAQARNAAREEEYKAADRLISESLVNVQLATSKAEAARIQAELERLKESPTGGAGGGRS
jgi:hypothetical protein